MEIPSTTSWVPFRILLQCSHSISRSASMFTNRRQILLEKWSLILKRVLRLSEKPLEMEVTRWPNLCDKFLGYPKGMLSKNRSGPWTSLKQSTIKSRAKLDLPRFKKTVTIMSRSSSWIKLHNNNYNTLEVELVNKSPIFQSWSKIRALKRSPRSTLSTLKSRYRSVNLCWSTPNH